MTWKTEFPNFPAADMPEIPQGWDDVSDAFEGHPSFYVAAGDVKIFVRESDAATRESAWEPGCSRYSADAAGADCLDSDDWAAILEFVAKAAP